MTTFEILSRVLPLTEADLAKISLDGWCEDQGLFMKVLSALPDEPITLVLKNFTTERVGVISIDIEGLREGWDRIYLVRPSLMKIFPQLTEWMEQHRSSNKFVSVDEFITHGNEVATLIGRPFKFFNQYGSGDPLQAGFTEYGPYMPVK